MRMEVPIYRNVATKRKSLFRLRVNKHQYQHLLDGKDLVIKGKFRLFQKRKEAVFSPIFVLQESNTDFIGVSIEQGSVLDIPSHYIPHSY